MSCDFSFNKEYELSELVYFVNEKISSTKLDVENYVSTENMIVDRGGVEVAEKIPSSANFNKFRVTDTLFSNIRTYFRKVWFSTFDGGASPDVLIFRTKNPQVLDPNYLYYVISDKKFIDYTVLTSKGAKMPRGDKAAIMKYKFFLPEPNAQKEIGRTLNSFDNKNINNVKISKTIEQLAQALFKSWFVDFEPVRAKVELLSSGRSKEDAELAAMCVISAKNIKQLNQLRANNPEAFGKIAQTATLFPSAMQDSEQGEIPAGWEIKQLSEICEVINGRAYKNTEFKTSGTPIVRIQNLSNGGKTVYSDLELSPDKYIESEDFIYAWSATFGPYIWRGPKSIYHYHIWKMEVDESIVSRYFVYLSMFRKTEAMKNAGTGSIFTHLTKGLMESQKILIANHELNMAFSEILENLFRQITVLKTESDNLSILRDTLLPELLSGKRAKGE